MQLTRCMSSFVLRYIIYPAQKHFTVLHRPVSCVSQNTTTREVKNSFAAVGAVQQRLHFRQVQLLLQQGRGLLRHWILQVSFYCCNTSTSYLEYKAILLVPILIHLVVLCVQQYIQNFLSCCCKSQRNYVGS